jgi:hypothetical protein
LTKIEFFDASNTLLFSRTASVAGNEGLSFLGAVANSGEQISRVRVTSGANTIVANGVLGDPNNDVVVMGDFLFAAPAATTTPEPGSLGLLGLGTLTFGVMRKRRGDQ